MDPTPLVTLSRHPTRGGHSLGVATLRSEATLNALSLPMIADLDQALREWAADPTVAAVVLQGAGRAFCAGGDVRALHRLMVAHTEPGVAPEVAAFFAAEYRLDHRIHTFPKPILCWGHGAVMGGGIGLMVGASHRVVTESSRLAMPEITIGLYPDVGASWFLPRLPGQLGLFLACTGARLDAADALAAGLADHLVPAERQDKLMQQLHETDWTGDAPTDRNLLTRALQGVAIQPAETARLTHYRARIDALIGAPDPLQVVVDRLVALADDSDPWLAAAGALVRGGSPTSQALIRALWERAAGRSLADVFRLEYALSTGCSLHPDFREGVRALLVDRDQSPRWTPATLAEVSETWVAGHFLPIAPATHPLADLS